MDIVDLGPAARLPADWRPRIPRDLAVLAQAWREPDAWTGVTRIAGMGAPAAMVGQTVADELAVHGWDVARALAQPHRADPDVPFGPSRPMADDAPALDQVLALAGRDLTWTAAT